MKKCGYNKLANRAFTIVELLVVIVVIGILAAITIVSYSGIQNKAIGASLQSDLDNDAKLLKLYNIEYGYYPDAINSATYCPTSPTVDVRYCLKTSADTVLAYSGGGQAFTLTATKNGISYEITEGLSPYNSTKIPITSISNITGVLQVPNTLTAGTITPADATVSYQWRSATSAGGSYTDISGATASTYTLKSSDANKFIKVVAIGTGRYIGTQTSNETTTAIVADPNWIVVGTQSWAKANLNVGTMITGTTLSQTNNATIEKYCYNNSESSCTAYGGLYQWGEAMQYSTTEGAQGICPAGSHIPSDAEWKVLEMSLSGMSQSTADKTGSRGTNEGTKLKSGGSSGLDMLLVGIHNPAGPFTSMSTDALFWTSTESSTNAWVRNIFSSTSVISRYTVTKDYGISIRCLAN